MIPPCVARVVSLLVALACSGCAGGPAEPCEPPHPASSTIRLVDGALRPANDVAIPTMAQVVFQNDTRHVAMVAVESATCPACAGVVGFEAVPGGVRSRPIPPGGFAALCFHAPGRHPFAFAVAGSDRRGVITVAAAK